HLRERILVLFEGLNSIKKDDLENRLNLTINFLEFLLANIEDKLKK
ncbi:CiaD-like domain-containing protein, partial [Campylobacter jejuni]